MGSPKHLVTTGSSNPPSKDQPNKKLPAALFSRKLTSKLVNEIVDDLEYDVDKDAFLEKKK
jgi:hypothetical protein